MSTNEIVTDLSKLEARRFSMFTKYSNAEIREWALGAETCVETALIVHLIDQITILRDHIKLANEAQPKARKIIFTLSPTRAKILKELDKRGPATSDDLEHRLEMSHQTCSTRFMELRDAGYIERCEHRLTRNGNKAWAHRITASGKIKLLEWQYEQDQAKKAQTPAANAAPAPKDKHVPIRKKLRKKH